MVNAPYDPDSSTRSPQRGMIFTQPAAARRRLSRWSRRPL